MKRADGQRRGVFARRSPTPRPPKLAGQTAKARSSPCPLPGPPLLTLLRGLDLPEQPQHLPPFLLVEHQEVEEVTDQHPTELVATFRVDGL